MEQITSEFKNIDTLPDLSLYLLVEINTSLTLPEHDNTEVSSTLILDISFYRSVEMNRIQVWHSESIITSA